MTLRLAVADDNLGLKVDAEVGQLAGIERDLDATDGHSCRDLGEVHWLEWEPVVGKLAAAAHHPRSRRLPRCQTLDERQLRSLNRGLWTRRSSLRCRFSSRRLLVCSRPFQLFLLLKRFLQTGLYQTSEGFEGGLSLWIFDQVGYSRDRT